MQTYVCKRVSIERQNNAGAANKIARKNSRSALNSKVPALLLDFVPRTALPCRRLARPTRTRLGGFSACTDCA